MIRNNRNYSKNLFKPIANPFGTEEFVLFRQVFGLHRFKLQRHLVDGTVKSVWFRQIFGLLGVRFRQILLYLQFVSSICTQYKRVNVNTGFVSQYIVSELSDMSTC